MQSNRFVYNVLFIVIVVLMALLYHYPNTAGFGPVSLHSWRQADGASLARMYYENGMSFFEPKVHNQVGGHNHAVGEFPILYYCVAVLYKLFGPHDVVFRVFNFMILFVGMLALFNLLFDRLRHRWLAFAPPLFIFVSPLLVYYGLNFLPNTTALGLLLIAAWCYHRYLLFRNILVFYLSMFILLIVALIKVTVLIPFIALVASAFLIAIIPSTRKKIWSYFPPLPHLFSSTAAIVLVFIGWFMWANAYNANHNAGIFLLSIKPIWAMAEGEIAWTRKFILTEQRYMYYNLVTLILLGLWLVYIIVRPRILPLPFYLITLFTALGSIAFMMLFFSQLAIHNYYFIDIFSLPILLFALGVCILDGYQHIRLVSIFTVLGLIFLFLGNLYSAAGQQTAYYTIGGTYAPPPFPSLLKKEALDAFLYSHDIKYPEMAYVVPDISPNVGLYHFNLRGWSLNAPLADSDLKQYAEWGCRYLIVLDPSYLNEHPLPKATSRPIGLFDGQIAFYDLQVLLD